ncbi:hypothetical protein [Sphingomonas psychrotolerans]|uniref:Uncharacterized protein n=1 Tax=Sphingomonas psychrotolerans TaxID=1327635 RepID=A0A2K8MHC1_9SPHN|nr:hypothetical protein [Sphingomonas psychrotolerans]ATY31149.1 hypothetical protein CVN68_03440 [Sphingomonas psychrotolerans]
MSTSTLAFDSRPKPWPRIEWTLPGRNPKFRRSPSISETKLPSGLLTSFVLPTSSGTGTGRLMIGRGRALILIGNTCADAVPAQPSRAGANTARPISRCMETSRAQCASSIELAGADRVDISQA